MVFIVFSIRDGGMPRNDNFDYHLHMLFLLLVVRLFLRDWAWWKTMESQKPGNVTGSGPEVVERQLIFQMIITN